MLHVNKVYFDYQDQCVLKNVNFQLASGGLLHLKGSNGAGKTTLLKLIAGLYTPRQGSIEIFEQPMPQYQASHQQTICFVGHKTAVCPSLSLRENCYFDLHCDLEPHELDILAAQFRLETHMDKLCATLSAGQKRQVGLLRLWMSSATLWLLDEPFDALDAFAFSVLRKKIEQHRHGGGAVIFTSHQNGPFADSPDYQEYCL
ncbi:MAG: heme ABC exporter ATP-binding protein CcmA [Legionella sp.]|nr:heme ABC exporter ATP-binding protein CcmA [Legionella sp.]